MGESEKVLDDNGSRTRAKDHYKETQRGWGQGDAAQSKASPLCHALIVGSVQGLYSVLSRTDGCP